MRKVFLLILVVVAWCGTGAIAAVADVSVAEASDAAEAVEWIETLGGETERDAAGQIIAVSLRHTWLTDADLDRLAKLESLERIDLAHTKITDLGLERLIPLQNVRELNLYYAEYVTDLGIAHLKHWLQLEKLNVRGTKVTSVVLQHVSDMKHLRFLDIGHSRVTDDLFEELVNLESLEHFAFGGNKMSGVSLPLLKLLPELRVLSVAGEQRTDSGLWSVAVSDSNIEHLAQLEQLEALDLAGCTVGDRGLAQLSGMRNLRSLDVSRTRITSRGVASLADLPNLRVLKLWQNSHIDDEVIASVLAMPKLEVLYLQETQVSAEGLKRLASHAGLRHLYIGGLPLERAQVEELRRAMPGCQVSWWKAVEIEYKDERGR